MSYSEDYYKKHKKEIIIKALESRGYTKDPYEKEGYVDFTYEKECYVDLTQHNYFWFCEDGEIQIFIFADSPRLCAKMTCTLDQLNYIELAVEHNTGNECFLEIEYSRENRIRPIPSWYK